MTDSRKSPSSSSSEMRTAKGFLLELTYDIIVAGVTTVVSVFIFREAWKSLNPGGAAGAGATSSSSGGSTSTTARSAQERLVRSSRGEIAERRARAQFNAYEDVIAGDLVFPEDIDVDFSQVGGLEREKTEIYNLVALPLKKPELFFSQRSKLLNPPKGILLYGPPGTGKTMIAKALAKESGAAFINLKMSTTQNMWMGESQKLVRATFTLARKLAPSIIFIDEVDSFLRERRSDENAGLGNMKAEFMALWDGIGNGAEDGNDVVASRYGVIVIGATNRPGDVDPAILRRLSRSFEIKMPDARERENILRLILKEEKLEPELEAALGRLTDELKDYSGSDLKELCRCAATFPFREFVESASIERSGRLKKNILNEVAGTGRQERNGKKKDRHVRFRGDPETVVLNGGGVEETQEGGEEEEQDRVQEMRPLRVSDFEAAMKEVRPTGENAYEYGFRAEHARMNAVEKARELYETRRRRSHDLHGGHAVPPATNGNGHIPVGGDADDDDKDTDDDDDNKDHGANVYHDARGHDEEVGGADAAFLAGIHVGLRLAAEKGGGMNVAGLLDAVLKGSFGRGARNGGESSLSSDSLPSTRPKQPKRSGEQQHHRQLEALD